MKGQPIFKGMSGYEIDRIALAIVEGYQPAVLRGKEPFDIHRFVDTMLEDLTGMEVVYTDDLPYEIYGLTNPNENKVLIQACLAEDEWEEKFFRSTIGHEAGHCFLHVPQIKQGNVIFQQRKNESVNLYRENKIPIFRNPEWQAHRFSGALLVPERPLRKFLNEGMSIEGIADFFNVNVAFLKSRTRGLKIDI